MRRIAAICLLLALILSVPALALTGEEKETAALQAGRAALAACLDESMTDLEKLTVLHDWLALHCDYGLAPDNRTAYGALVEGAATCRGYAAGYALLAELAGLEGADTYSEEIDHAWILVTLDGSRYFSDCTWDDGKNGKLGLIRHAYWLFDGDNAWEAMHYGWDTLETIPGGALERAPWGEAVTQVIFSGAWAYYIDQDFRLMRCDRSTWAAEALLTFSDRWPDLDPEDEKTPEIYSGLTLLRERLYFNTPAAVLSVDLGGGDLRTELTPDTSERLIYGTAVREGRLCYSLAEGPDDLAYEVLDTGIPATDAWGY